MIQIKSLNPCFNPYSFNNRVVNSINLYSKTGEITFSRRWFGNNNIVKILELPVDEIVKKRKIKADGTVFCISQSDYSGKNWDIYIPEEMLNFGNGEITLTGEFREPFLNGIGDVEYKKVYETRTFKITEV